MLRIVCASLVAILLAVGTHAIRQERKVEAGVVIGSQSIAELLANESNQSSEARVNHSAQDFTVEQEEATFLDKLKGVSKRELKKMALGMGISEEEVNYANDEDDAMAAITQLMLSRRTSSHARMEVEEASGASVSEANATSDAKPPASDPSFIHFNVIVPEDQAQQWKEDREKELATGQIFGFKSI